MSNPELGGCTSEGEKLQCICNFCLNAGFSEANARKEGPSPGKQAEMKAILLEMFIHCF